MRLETGACIDGASSDAGECNTGEAGGTCRGITGFWRVLWVMTRV
jgi:hypothetical protein